MVNESINVSASPLPLESHATFEKICTTMVSTILEYRDCFEVYQLLEAKPETWRVQAVRFSKREFDT